MQATDSTGLRGLTDDALVAGLSTLCAEGHALAARIIVRLVEVEERRLDLRAGCTSMFDFCQRRLGMSEGAAFRRITAARLVKRFPGLLARIERGELHLSALVLLRPHLTEANVDELAAAVAGKTQRAVEELLARLTPRPDVPSAIVELDATATATPALSLSAGSVPAPTTPAAARARIEPLSEARYRVQLTASAELTAKLERARDLMRHRNPSGDLAVVLDAAMDLLLAKLERERLGKVKSPRRANGSGSGSGSRGARAIPVGVRRAVFARDGERCSFVGATGERCPQRGHLELDHVEARALGGTNEPSNLRVLCRAHNRLAAEEAFGKTHVAAQIDFRQRKSRTVAAPPPPSRPRPPPPLHVTERVLRGLESLGFNKADARRAVSHVVERRLATGHHLDVQDLLRGSIAALT